MNFNEYVLPLCRKVDKKLRTLIRISKLTTFPQKRNIPKAFTESLFGYCPLVSMFWGRQANARINHILERALREGYNDEVSPLEELLPKDSSGTIHQRNIKTLVTEFLKIKKSLSNGIMAQLFYKRNSIGYNIRP